MTIGEGDASQLCTSVVTVVTDVPLAADVKGKWFVIGHGILERNGIL